MAQTSFQTTIPFQSWDLDLLVDYVLKFHHRNIRRKGEDLAVRLNALAGSHPELNRVTDHFRNSVADLDMHCQKEENILFPYIIDIFNAAEYGQEHAPFHCGSIQFPINAMMADHSEELERHERIAELTNDYTAPEGAEPEYVQALADLRQFRDNLLEHVYVENEIIFPRALMLESNNENQTCLRSGRRYRRLSNPRRPPMAKRYQ